MNRIAIVIPYYQIEKGVLLRAVSSILAQTILESINQVLIVDDESPVSAKDELRALQAPSRLLTIIRQSNAGPGAARNTGLEHIADDTDYIAFLDSDDYWRPDHLETAIAALEMGYDFYFSNYMPSGENVSWFEFNKVDLKNYRLLDKPRRIYSLESGLFDKLFVKSDLSPVGTPTIVYRFDGYSDIRFPEHFIAGEDSAFTFYIASRTRRAVFSSKVQCVCGKGVNISAGSTWGMPGYLRQSSHAVFFRKYVSEEFELSNTNQAIQKDIIKNYRDEFIKAMIYSFRHRYLFDARIVANHFLKDPQSVLRIFPVIWSLLCLRRRRSKIKVGIN